MKQKATSAHLFFILRGTNVFVLIVSVLFFYIFYFLRFYRLMAPRDKAGKKTRVSKTEKAGLKFPVGRVQRHIREGNYADRVGTGGAVFLTAVLEYLTAEVLDVSGIVATENKKHRIIPRHIMMAIKNDSELEKLLGDVLISGSGVVPFIHEALLPKNSKLLEKQQKDANEISDIQSQEM